jgi:hypothetical protein
MPTVVHTVTRESHTRRGNVLFSASCSCGAHLERVTTAGMVSAWEWAHQSCQDCSHER